MSLNLPNPAVQENKNLLVITLHLKPVVKGYYLYFGDLDAFLLVWIEMNRVLTTTLIKFYY